MGKTTAVRYLACHFGVPQLGSDTLKRAIKASPASHNADAGWLTFDLLFALADDFLQQGSSVFLDLNLGKPFHWSFLDSMREKYPGVQVLPVLLRCSREICLARIRARHAVDPSYDPPELYLRDAGLLAVWDFLEELDRPDAYFVDASLSPEQAQADITTYLTRALASV